MNNDATCIDELSVPSTTSEELPPSFVPSTTSEELPPFKFSNYTFK